MRKDGTLPARFFPRNWVRTGFNADDAKVLAEERRENTFVSFARTFASSALKSGVRPVARALSKS